MICERSRWHCYKGEIGYYELEGITLENWYEKFYEDLKNDKDINDIIASIKMKKVDPKKYLIIDPVTKTAGFVSR